MKEGRARYISAGVRDYILLEENRGMSEGYSDFFLFIDKAGWDKIDNAGLIVSLIAYKVLRVGNTQNRILLEKMLSGNLTLLIMWTCYLISTVMLS